MKRIHFFEAETNSLPSIPFSKPSFRELTQQIRGPNPDDLPHKILFPNILRKRGREVILNTNSFFP